jgi:hypothetical protein
VVRRAHHVLSLSKDGFKVQRIGFEDVDSNLEP